jgi:5-methyltetrahydropteroyltriglutamate--homocysteine methyltransferase
MEGVNHPDTNGMIEYFIAPMSGIDTQLTRAEQEAFYREAEAQGLGYRAVPAGIVRGPVDEGTLNLPRDWRFVRGLTERPQKFTLTGPHMLTKVLSDGHYRDRAALCMAIARVLRRQIEVIDAAVVQIDEANISGHPEDAPWAAPAINHVLEGIRPGSERGIHICFGNYGGQSVQKGFWKNLLPFLNRLSVDHLVLEFARRGYGEVEAFADLRPEIKLGLGVVDIKDNGVETPDTVAERIAQGAEKIGADRVGWVHPDCGFWMLPRSVADAKMSALVRGRDLFLGQ